MMTKKTAYRAKGGKTGSRKGKGPKLVMDPKILDKMTNKEIANMLAYHFGAEGIGAKKKGGTVGKKLMTAKKGGRVSSKSKSGCKPNRLY